MRMRISFLAAVFVPLVVAHHLFENPDDGKIWALLIAGSNGYFNYRHQADVCHAYQILHRHGIPDENIVVMMYDDIANNSENPYKGVIMNRPNGTNVYKGVIKDYTGDDVSAANFLNILQGNKEAMKDIGSGKVIESGPNDRIFVYFTDHGGAGFLHFPNDILYADDLVLILKKMIHENSFKEMLFYVEACHSGSVFEAFLKGHKFINIVAGTAANANENSHACYCENELGTCLGDEYSVAWMEHVDCTDGTPTAATETVIQQYQVVRNRVKQSHPQLFGGEHIKYQKVHKFMGLNKNNSIDKYQDIRSYTVSAIKDTPVSCIDVSLFTMQQKLKLAKTEQEKAKYAEHISHLIKGREFIDATIEEIIFKVTGYNFYLYTIINTKQKFVNIYNMMCYKYLIEQFRKHCFDHIQNNYVIKHFYKLLNLCSVSFVYPENVVSIFESVCTSKHRNASAIH